MNLFKINNINKKLLSLFFIFGFLFLANSISATQVEWPTAPITGAEINESSEMHDLIAYFYGWGISIGVIIAFIMIVIAGIEYMLSAATANPGLGGKAIGRIKSAILGLILLLSSWLILNTINPQITQLQPLPNLWDTDDLVSDLIAMDRVLEPPCEFVLFYKERDFQGSYTKRTPDGTSAGEPGLYIEKPDYQSVIGFRKMREDEKEMMAEMEKSGQTDARKRYGSDYIEGSSCSITFYESSGALWWHNVCGRAASYVLPPRKTLDTSLLEDINCYRVEDISIKDNENNE